MISGQTQVAGIIGWPVAHSLSPAMHNAAFGALGLDWAYVAFPVDPARVGAAVRGLAAAGVAGLNVTIPHKQAVLADCSAVSDAAAAIGAANTLVPDGAGGWRADNTDAPGFLRALDEAAPLELDGRTALVIGAGGAARAVVFALRQRGARVLWPTGPPRGRPRSAIRSSSRAAPSRRPRARARWWSTARALACTTTAFPGELPLDALGPGHVVVDVVYRPGGTAWLAAAEARGARCVDGLGMLLHQGAAAFVQWTGQEPPIAVMREALVRSGR